MPKKIALTAEQEQLMIKLFSTVPRDIGNARRRPKNSIKPIIHELQRHGVTLCEDSIRRRATALGLIEPVGAKYIPRTITQMWSRPCMLCKSTLQRPKNQYICNTCSGRAS
jgi:hypothetical protein